ncbi:MAG: hypothetical protein ABFR90_00515 [Planctomycetota bacterium]
MKMNISMEALKPLTGTLKKYTALFPSIAVTVVALLLFLPTMMVGNKVKEQMKQSAQYARTVKGLSGKVPSKDEPGQIKISMDKLQKEADDIKRFAVESSRRDLVTYDFKIFPEPDDRSSQIFTEFGGQYRTAIKELLEKMNAKDAPSDAEIRAETGGAGGRRQPAGYARAGTVDTEDPVVNALCMARAQEISIYANPSAFPWYAFWEDYEFSGEPQALEDCWDCQVALWIYEDIVDTVTKMNGSTGKVLSLPVKRLLGVSFSGPVTVGTGRRSHFGSTRGTAMRDIPNYVGGMLAGNFLADSPTARKGDENIDVIHFAVSVLVDNRFIMPFMKELCSEKSHTFYPTVFKEPFIAEDEPVQSRHNQISILQTDLKVVDKTAKEHELYRYGKGATMRLDLVCEYQFNRLGYDEIKPEPIEKRLGQFKEDDQEDAFGAPGGMPGEMEMF